MASVSKLHNTESYRSRVPLEKPSVIKSLLSIYYQNKLVTSVVIGLIAYVDNL